MTRQMERYNATYTVIFGIIGSGTSVTICRNPGGKMTFTGPRADALRSEIAHAPEPAAVVDDWWTNSRNS